MHFKAQFQGPISEQQWDGNYQELVGLSKVSIQCSQTDLICGQGSSCFKVREFSIEEIFGLTASCKSTGFLTISQ